MLGWFEKLRDLLLAMVRQGVALRLPQTAGSLAFLSLLAMVPVVSIALSVLTALPVFGRLRETLLKFVSANLFLPSFADTVVRYVNQFASQASELSLLGAGVFFATAFSALLTIDHALNRIWMTDRPRSLPRRLTLYWTLLTLGPLTLAVSLTLNGIVFTDWLSDLPTRSVQRAWVTVLPWLLGLAGLTLMYRLLPNAPVRWRDAFIGAALATVILELLKRWLGLYVAKLPTYTVVYGAFAALPLFLVWLFLLWLTVLVGALCAANLRHWGSGASVHLAWTPAQRFEAGARVLQALASAHRGGRGPMTVHSLRPSIGQDPQRAEELAALLGRLGYLHRHWLLPGDGLPVDAERAVWDEHWSLAGTPEQFSLRPLFESIWRQSERAGKAPAGADAGQAAIDAPMLDRPL